MVTISFENSDDIERYCDELTDVVIKLKYKDYDDLNEFYRATIFELEQTIAAIQYDSFQLNNRR